MSIVYIWVLIFNNNCRSADCFRLGWPMRADADFFWLPVAQRDFENSNVSVDHKFIISHFSHYVHIE